MSFTQESKKYDAILLAGEGESSYKVFHQHKSFLRLKGKCIIQYVIEALQQVESVRDIYIVGSRDNLLKAIEEDGIDLKYPKRIYVLEQKANLYENIWHTFLATLPKKPEEHELEDSPYQDKAVLIVPSDAPLITPHEIEYFISHCDLENYDHILGLTPSESLEYFYPKEGKPGIKMAYLNLKEKMYRINNLHMVKPIRIKNRKYIQEVYQYRYQRNIRNVLLFGRSLLGNRKPNQFKYYLILQLSSMFSKLGINVLAKLLRSWIPKKGLEKCVSQILQTRLMGQDVPFPGAALDIDNDHDYQVILSRFDEWREHLQQLDQSHTLPYGSEYTL